MNKYLTENELVEFRTYIYAYGLTQTQIGALCYRNNGTISVALRKNRFERGWAELVYYKHAERHNAKPLIKLSFIN